MLRIVDIPLRELPLDAAAVSARLNATVRRDRLRVTGAGAVNDRLLIFCEETVAECEYRLAPFDGASAPEIIALVRARYDASFATIAVFEYGKLVWGLFEKIPEAARP